MNLTKNGLLPKAASAQIRSSNKMFLSLIITWFYLKTNGVLCLKVMSPCYDIFNRFCKIPIRFIITSRTSTADLCPKVRRKHIASDKLSANSILHGLSRLKTFQSTSNFMYITFYIMFSVLHFTESSFAVQDAFIPHEPILVISFEKFFLSHTTLLMVCFFERPIVIPSFWNLLIVSLIILSQKGHIFA